LLCGSFGVFGIITQATLKLHPLQRQAATALVAVASADQAVELACALEQELGEFVSAFEGLSNGALNAVAKHQGQVFSTTPEYAVLMEVSSAIAPGRGLDLEAMLLSWLEAQVEAGVVVDAVVDKPAQLWRLRHATSESVQALGRLVAFDIAVPRSSIGAFRRRVLSVIESLVPGTLPCDFGHLGDGGIHLNLVVPDGTADERIASLRSAVYDEVVYGFAGSFSAEHGVGPYNQVFYDRYSEPPLRAVCDALQQALDPEHRLGRVRLGNAATMASA
jgi:FAD/FMN-containing dehydrogenase